MIHPTSETDIRAYIDGGWFEAADGTLYVVPLGDREAWGPDNPVKAQLLTDRRGGGSAWPSLLCRLWLAPVPYDRRRWSSERGFYKEE